MFYSYTRPLGRVPSPQVGIGLGYKRKVDLMVLMNTDMLLLTLWTGANGLRSAREADHERRSADLSNR